MHISSTVSLRVESRFVSPGGKTEEGQRGNLLRSAMAGRLYKLQLKNTSNSGFVQTLMPCSGYILFAAQQRVGYKISWVHLQREENRP